MFFADKAALEMAEMRAVTCFLLVIALFADVSQQQYNTGHIHLEELDGRALVTDTRDLQLLLPTTPNGVSGRQKFDNRHFALCQLSSNTCRKDWVRLGGSCYKFGREPSTWSESSWICRANGGYLAEINSEEENDVVVAQIRTIREKSNNDIPHWIGASDIFVEGHWSWLSNDGFICPFSNWSTGQPDNAGGVEHCMEIRPAFDYKWNDYLCSFKNLFVCESSPS